MSPESTAEPWPQTVDEPRWFDASRRLVGGRPDSRYGWLDTAHGPCIVKALDTGLTAYAATLLSHERRMLARLAALGAPVPSERAMGRPDWLVTDFAGLTLERLAQPAPGERDPLLSTQERLAVWVHLLRQLAPLAAAGVLVIDLHAGNVVVPLTEVIRGQARLHTPRLIDHAHTVEAGFDLRRPVWIDPHQARVAPELRAVLLRDQAHLKRVFEQAGAELPGRTRLPGPRDDHDRYCWASYDEAQHLQALLDGGSLDAAAAMQHAVGVALLTLIDASDTLGTCQAKVDAVVRRMCATAPADRWPGLLAAADALASAMSQRGDPLPLVGQARLPAIGPEWLVAAPAFDVHTAAVDKPGSDAQAPPQSGGMLATAAMPGTLLIEARLPRQVVDPPAAQVPGASGQGKVLRERSTPQRWGLALALAIGALVGYVLV
ncbi:hypothetical protein [Sphaerotilus mobilis]|uniref:Uncharacterized protein n=1 Tax=Sphaerotilus mobilis TaxID=47994 RepID=A0A4Q7LQX2_9BURK|nr:hypothetical protein [Sphaerotilus mobilis]RZS57104.1 hypothetical protein EV685_1668 [Sphaerotilus mobilis]